MTAAARVASDRLTRALLDLAAKGRGTHCSDPETHHFWLSEQEGERREAMRLCRGCPVLTVCRDTAVQRDERWGVWGGKDFLNPTRTTEEETVAWLT